MMRAVLLEEDANRLPKRIPNPSSCSRTAFVEAFALFAVWVSPNRLGTAFLDHQCVWRPG